MWARCDFVGWLGHVGTMGRYRKTTSKPKTYFKSWERAWTWTLLVFLVFDWVTENSGPRADFGCWTSLDDVERSRTIWWKEGWAKPLVTCSARSSWLSETLARAASTAAWSETASMHSASPFIRRAYCMFNLLVFQRVYSKSELLSQIEWNFKHLSEIE